MKIPSNPEAEIAVIGCCLAGGLDASIEAVEAIPPAAFMREDCKMAFQVIESLATQGSDVNTYTFMQAWKGQFSAPIPQEIIESDTKIPGVASLTQFADSLVDNSKRRRVLEAAQHLLTGVQDQTKQTDLLIASAESLLYGEEIKGTPILTSKTCSRALLDDLDERNKLNGKRSGIETGFKRFDDITDGLQYGEQTIIAARPSVGKTAMLLNIVENACLRNKIPTLVITLEMSEKALLRRLLSSWARIPMNVLRGGSYNAEQYRKFAMFSSFVNQAPLYIVNGVSGMDCNRLSAVTRRAVRKYGIKLAALDYLQKTKASEKHEKRTYEVAQVSSTTKSIAVSTGIAFLVAAQLNRESEKEKGRTPRLTDLADSGQIERDGDTIGLLHRPDRTSSEATLGIAKQRDGECGIIPLHYEGQFCRFENEKPT